ncbi:MAG: FliG C-terminal domain-containing protein [Bacteroidota bacterium]|nr:FliG C-terminal domain-containing protein [Bacteroidota bacterium]
MRNICFYFQVHQPNRLKLYRFFNIGNDHYYFDDYRNNYILRRVANKCYLPANKVMLDLIREYGTGFKISYSISGTALDQFERFAPDVLHSFQELAATGCVEFLAETYSHSLSALASKEEFTRQVNAHADKIEKLFGKRPETFRNTELIYSDYIGEMVAEMGFKTMLTEGAKHILGWKSPNYLYCNAVNPKLKILLKNFQLSDDIAFRFSQTSWGEWPLTTEKYVDWLNAINPNEQIVNLFMDYETFGEHQWPETGIFEFLKALPNRVFSHSNYKFCTPSEAANTLQPVAPVHVNYPISWADEERDLTAWLGNELQDEAFSELYSLREKVYKCNDEDLNRDWRYLQTSDHFYYMCTKWFSDGDVHKYFNPYNSPYEAFINFMNIISDFQIRIDEKYQQVIKQNESIENQKSQKTTRVKKAVSKTNESQYKLTHLLNLSDNDVKKIIKAVNVDVLANVLANASDELSDKIIKNLSTPRVSDVKHKSSQINESNAEEIEENEKILENILSDYIKKKQKN